MYETEQILTGITETHTTADSGFVIGSGTGHVSAYVRETGDTSILTQMVPFDNDMSVAAPLMDHLKRSLDYIINHKGPHNLPLIGRA